MDFVTGPQSSTEADEAIPDVEKETVAVTESVVYEDCILPIESNR